MNAAVARAVGQLIGRRPSLRPAGFPFHRHQPAVLCSNRRSISNNNYNSFSRREIFSDRRCRMSSTASTMASDVRDGKRMVEAAAADDDHSVTPHTNVTVTVTTNTTSTAISSDEQEEVVKAPADDDENEQEEMFVDADPGFAHRTKEWGGPRRGGRFPEPTRFGDWERKGRCSDF